MLIKCIVNALKKILIIIGKGKRQTASVVKKEGGKSKKPSTLSSFAYSLDVLPSISIFLNII